MRAENQSDLLTSILGKKLATAPQKLSLHTLDIYNHNELQLIQLHQTLQYYHQKNDYSKLKQLAVKLYSMFNSMKSIFMELDIVFLYEQIIEFFNCFGRLIMIFDCTSSKEEHRSKSRNSIRLEPIYESRVEGQQQVFPNVKAPKLGGVSLYNQSYTRYLDQETHIEGLSETKKTPRPTINILSEKQLESEEINNFIKERKGKKYNYTSYCFDDLMKIEEFLMDTQKETNQFIINYQIDEVLPINQFSQRQMEILQHLDIEKHCKFQLRDRMVEIFNIFKKIVGQLKNTIFQKEQQIKKYLYIQQNKISIATQTKTDQDVVERLKHKVEQLSSTLQIYETSKSKMLEEERQAQQDLRTACLDQKRQIGDLKEKIILKDKSIKYYEQKVNYLNENMKLKNGDIISNFFALGDESKKFVISQLSNKGFLDLDLKKRRKRNISAIVDKVGKKQVDPKGLVFTSFTTAIKNPNQPEKDKGKKNKSLFFHEQSQILDASAKKLQKNIGEERKKKKQAEKEIKNISKVKKHSQKKKILISHEQASKSHKTMKSGKSIISISNLKEDKNLSSQKSFFASKKSIEFKYQKSSRKTISFKEINTNKSIHSFKNIEQKSKSNIPDDDLEEQVIEDKYTKNFKKKILPSALKKNTQLDQKRKLSSNSPLVNFKPNEKKPRHLSSNQEKQYQNISRFNAPNSLQKKEKNMEIPQKKILEILRKTGSRQKFIKQLKQYHSKQCQSRNCQHLDRYFKKFELYKRAANQKEALNVHIETVFYK